MNSANLKDSTNSRIWLYWMISSFLVVIIHASTLSIYHPINQDEVQILDYGRTALNPSTDWALSWDFEFARPVQAISYLGPAIQEIAYQLAGQSLVGPRFVAVLAAVLAATSMLGWLLVRGIKPNTAFVLALVFLLDPMFADIYRQGRIDGWPISAALFSCWQFALARKNLIAGSSWKHALLAAGIAFTISPFFWVSAPILAPLVMIEIILLLKAIRELPEDRRTGLMKSALCNLLIACGLSSVLLLAPILINWEQYWLSLKSAAVVQSAASATQIPIHQLLLVYDPLTTLLVLIALATYRDWPTIIAFILAIIMIQFTMIYPARVIYLLPYLYLMIAISLNRVADSHVGSIKRRGMQYGLAICCIWGIVLVLVVRPTVALKQRPANETLQIYDGLAKAIGPGSRTVLLEDWSAYYTARELGWKIYLAAVPISGSEYGKFLLEMDYVVVRASPIVHFATTRLAEQLGFNEVAVLSFEKSQAFSVPLGVTQLYVSETAYPSLRVWRNPQN